MIKRIIHFIARLYIKLRYGIRNNYAATSLAVDFYHDYKKRKESPLKIFMIHQRGFTAENWYFLNITKENYKTYLSDAQYYKMHPLNGKYSYIIDDKLNLKNYCHGTELDRYMPRYYYSINAEGKIEKLMDCPEEAGEPTAESIVRLLKEKSALAIKQTSGSLGIGFIKGEYKDGSYRLNGEELSEEELCARISELKSYLITEYLYPHRELAEYCPYTCNCIRYLIGRVNGRMKFLKGYIRFGTHQSGFVENYNSGGILCYLNEHGEFTEGNVIDYNSGLNRKISEHCDNNVRLAGKIPLWVEVEHMGESFDKNMPQMDYLGIDVVITSENCVKVLEINSLTSMDGLQLNGSILETEAGDFFRQYI